MAGPSWWIRRSTAALTTTPRWSCRSRRGPPSAADRRRPNRDAGAGHAEQLWRGKTPWGTYLTCEENFNGYFGSKNAEAAVPEGFDRYGISAESGYGYEKFDDRFDIEMNPNEPNRFGYVVEIDPADPTSTRSSILRWAGSSTRTPP